MNQQKKIVLIGCGNVGYHLGRRLKKRGVHIVQVHSRTKKRAKRLAKKINVPYTTDLGEIVADADLYILAVRDDVIGEVAAKISERSSNALMVHTSGATPSTVFAPYTNRYGIFYPLQTFSINRAANFKTIPLCVDAVELEDFIFLKQLAEQVCRNVYHITDEQRAILHVAAVFVNNFTNHLFHIGENIVEKEGLSFDILKPLMQETVEKIMKHPAKSMQTGPAIRGDKKTIERHLDYLEQYPDYQELYEKITKNIQLS